VAGRVRTIFVQGVVPELVEKCCQPIEVQRVAARLDLSRSNRRDSGAKAPCLGGLNAAAEAATRKAVGHGGAVPLRSMDRTAYAVSAGLAWVAPECGGSGLVVFHFVTLYLIEFAMTSPSPLKTSKLAGFWRGQWLAL
jgi:hypothetical protein